MDLPATGVELRILTIQSQHSLGFWHQPFFFFHGSNVVPGAQHRFGPRRLVSWSSLQTWLCVYHGVQLGEMTVPSIDKAKGSELLCSPSTHPSREV